MTRSDHDNIFFGFPVSSDGRSSELSQPFDTAHCACSSPRHLIVDAGHRLIKVVSPAIVDENPIGLVLTSRGYGQVMG
jgi:hypothetical protein